MDNIANALECIDAVLWFVLVWLLFRDRNKWNQKFQALYDELAEEIRND